MTARKVHFDFNAAGTQAFCGAQPREGAQPLEMSERRKEVTCGLCLAAIEKYDVEHDTITADLIERISQGPTDLAGHTGDLHRAIAGRHGLEIADVTAGFNAGWLKR